jgi:hypothetical protein
MGGWEDGRMGGWECGSVGVWEDGRGAGYGAQPLLKDETSVASRVHHCSSFSSSSVRILGSLFFFILAHTNTPTIPSNVITVSLNPS